MAKKVAHYSEQELLEKILDVLRQSAIPLPVTKVRAQLRSQSKAGTSVINSLMEAHCSDTGPIYNWKPPSVKTMRFWTRSRSEYRAITRDLIIREIRTSAQPRKALLSALKLMAPAFTGKEIDQLLGSLLLEGIIREYSGLFPPRFKVLAAEPPYSLYFQEAVKKIALVTGSSDKEVLAFIRNHFLQPATAKDDIDYAGLIVERMIQLKPAAATGALVSIRDLRRSIKKENIDKERFDETVMALARRGIVDLHRHDLPSSLSMEERDEMLVDKHGNYYIGIALR